MGPEGSPLPAGAPAEWHGIQRAVSDCCCLYSLVGSCAELLRAHARSLKHSGRQSQCLLVTGGTRRNLMPASWGDHNFQRPEAVESVFYMWRLSGDKKCEALILSTDFSICSVCSATIVSIPRQSAPRRFGPCGPRWPNLKRKRSRRLRFRR